MVLVLVWRFMTDGHRYRNDKVFFLSYIARYGREFSVFRDGVTQSSIVTHQPRILISFFLVLYDVSVASDLPSACFVACRKFRKLRLFSRGVFFFSRFTWFDRVGLMFLA